MSALPPEFLDSLPQPSVVKAASAATPVYYLWVFDPVVDTVTVEHNAGRHPAHHVDHTDLARRVPHPERIHGYAYRIKGGWRITDWEHRAVGDPHVLELVRQALHDHERHT